MTLVRSIGFHSPRSALLGHLTAALALLAVTVGCSSTSKQDLSLLPADRPSASAEIERLRQMERVQIVDTTTGETSDVSVDPVSTGLSLYAIVNNQCGSTSCASEATTSCEADICLANEVLCRAKTFLAIMNQVGGSPPRLGGFMVPPQSAATNADIGDLARFQAQGAATMAASEIDSLLGVPDAGTDCAGFVDGASNAGGAGGASHVVSTTQLVTLAASAYTEAFHVYREAAEVQYQALLAAADAQASSSSSLSVSNDRTVAGADLSRAAASHLLVGGANGLAGTTTTPFCTEPELAPDAQAALSLMRESALAPADLLAVTDIHSLLNGDDTAVPGGSVRARLVEHYPQLGTVTNLSNFFALNDAAFETARKYMVEEIASFSRSQTATLPVVAAPDGTLPKYKRYAGTASAPSKVSPVYFSALARYGKAPDTNINGRFLALPAIDFTDQVFQKSAGWLAEAEAKFPLAVGAGAFAPVALVLSTKELRGRVWAFTNRGGTTLTASGYTPEDHLLGVIGDDALRCAVDGNIEGAQCALDDTNSILLKTSVTSPDPDFSTAVYGQSTKLPGARLYIVQSRDLSGALDSRLPGHYVALAGYTRNGLGEKELPIVPALEQKAGKAIEPSRDWCATSHTSCSGVDLDDRLPLENELTQDQSPSESSWRHYLDLAAQAATAADNLGQDYLNEGLALSQDTLSVQLRQLEQAQRADDEITKLQDICGTAIDPNVLLKLLSGSDPTNPSHVTDGSCTITQGTGPGTGPQGSCSPGKDCIAGECVVNIQSLVHLENVSVATGAIAPDLQRIADCISDGKLETVSLGTSPVCYWSDALNPNSICTIPPPPSGVPLPPTDPKVVSACPILRTGDDCEATFSAQGGIRPSWTVPHESHALGYIANDGVPNETGASCSALRTLRAMTAQQAASPDGVAAFSQAIADNTFNPTFLQAVANRLDFLADYGGFASITVDGSPRYTTGSPGGGVPDNGWPCNDPHICGAGQSGLFCGKPGAAGDAPVFTCKDADKHADTAAGRTARAAQNYRMLRAVLAAKLIASDPTESEGKSIAGKRVILAGGLVWPLDTPDRAGKQDLPATTLTDFVNGAPIVKYSKGTEYDVFQTTLAPDDNPARLLWLTSKGVPTFGDFVMRRPAYVSFENGLSGSNTRRDASGYGKDYFLSGLSDYRGQAVPGLDASNGFFQAALRHTDIKYSLGTDGPRTYASFHYTLNLTDDPRSGDFLKRTLLTVDEDPSNADMGYIDTSAMLDGLELLCEVSKPDNSVSLQSPPVVRSVDDLARASAYIKLVSAEISRRSSLVTFTNMPETGVDALVKGSVSGSYPKYSGQMGTALSNLRGGLEQVQQTIPVLANEVRQFGDMLQGLHDTLQNLNLQGDISDLQLASTISSQTAACANSIGQAATVQGAFGGVLGGVATCANSIAQIAISTSIHHLEGQIKDNNVDAALAGFDSEFSTRITNLQTEALNFSKAAEAVDASLSTLEGLRDSARISISRSMYLLSAQAAGQAEVTGVIGNLYNGKQLRYQAALKNARLLAYTAKRAIEQHLGVRLSTMTNDLPLVDAPSKWEGTVCSLQGLDYNALKQTGTGSGGSGGVSAGAQSFAGGFIGDYVTKLQNVVESYPLVHNFQEGTDTAIISLRDDIMNVRAKCDSPSGNLLYQTVNLQPGGTPGWSQEHCLTRDIPTPPDSPQASQTPPPETITVDAIDCVSVADAGVPPLADFEYSEGRAFKVSFGAGATATTRLGQSLDLNQGSYRLTYYTTDGAAVQPAFIDGPDGAITPNAYSIDDASSGGGWTRRYVIFTVPKDGTVKIGFQRPTATTTAISIAAPMLEPLPGYATGQSFALKPFVGTTDTLSRPLPVCEDTSGAVFRATKWRHDCLMLCSDGYSDDCGSNAVKTCFHEAQFGFNQRDIQRGKIFNFTGFARGNFNYRIDTVALNFVGTGIRDCANSALPSTCNSAGFVPYTLLHNGPFYVRNYSGADNEVFLFDGKIEHARGLGTERYLTNPLSETDRGLITPYTRYEFQGRPLDANFLVRVWDDPSLNFDAIQDVQVVLNYRYWTASK